MVVYLTPFHDEGWAISLESALVGELMDDGTVELPVLDAAEEGSALGELLSTSAQITLDDLQDAASKEVTIDISE